MYFKTSLLLTLLSFGGFFNFLILCSSSQNRQKIIAYKNPLIDVCPNYGNLDVQTEQFKKATHFPYELNSDPAFQQVAISYGSNYIQSVYVTSASNAKSIKNIKLWKTFKAEYKLFCPNVSNRPDWYIETESKFVKEMLIECSNKEYSVAEKCFANTINDTEIKTLPLFFEILNEENKKPLSNWQIVKYLKTAYSTDNEILFKLHLYDAKERIKIEDVNKELKTKNVFKVLKSAEEIDQSKFKTSLNYTLYSSIFRKLEDLKNETLNLQKMDDDIKQKSNNSGVCSYLVFGEFIKMLGNTHIFKGSSRWNGDGSQCEAQKLAFKNNYAGIVQDDFLGITNPEKNDYRSPTLVALGKAYLINQVTLTNGIKIYVFTKTAPTDYAKKEAEIKKLTDSKNLMLENINKAWPILEKELANLNIKILD